MSLRTCLLCGKPLSRIWSGSSEEFCSREHRNQYRLRQGMDRLLESTRVSNVMRRRELPMTVAQPAGPAGSDSARLAESRGIRVRSHNPKPMIPATAARLHAGIPEGREWVRERQIAGASAAPRDFRMLRQGKARPVPIVRRPRLASAALGIDPRKKSSPFGPEARKGRALRVSMGAGFHVPKFPKRAFAPRPIAPPGLKWSDQAHGPLIQESPVAPRAFGVLVSTQEIRRPGNRAAVTVDFKWPGLMPIAATAPNGERGRRDSTMPLGRDERAPVTSAFPSLIGALLRGHIRGSGLSANFARTLQAPAEAAAAFRVATVRFDSQYLASSSSTQEYPIQ
jgi:hypothetical protein